MTRFKGQIRQLATILMANRRTVPILAGPARGLRVPKEAAIAYPSVIVGNYEQAVTKAIQSLTQPIRVAYDIGAHIGLTTLILVKIFGDSSSVFAFEPEPENFSSLLSLVSANPGIRIYPAPLALSDSVCEAKFYRSHGSSMGLLGAIALEDGTRVNEDESQIVSTTTLDAFVFDAGNAPPDFIKIDVEGAEGLVLAGGLRTIRHYRPVLLLELHGPVHAASVYDLLTPSSYSWRYIRPRIGLSESIEDLSQLLAYFGRGDDWTQHVLLQP